jgi:hypothetical protein
MKIYSFVCVVFAVLNVGLFFVLGTIIGQGSVYRNQMTCNESAKVELQGLKGGDALEVQEKIKLLQYKIEEDKKLLDKSLNGGMVLLGWVCAGLFLFILFSGLYYVHNSE